MVRHLRWRPRASHPSLISYHARLGNVKNVSAGISERQALSNLIRFSRSRDPIIKYDSLSTLMSPVDVNTLAGLEHRDIPLLPIISGWEWAEKRLARLLSCVGMSKLLDRFLLFLATVASSHAEDRRLARIASDAYCYFRKRGGLQGGRPVRRTIPLRLLRRRYGRSK
jgi:hypothetical protein